jgi:hypothetical protein
VPWCPPAGVVGAARYTATLDDLAATLVAWRCPERVAAASAATTASPSGRRIRVGESGLEAAPITLSHYDIAVRPLDERLAKLKTEREVTVRLRL